ncbi:MULTISPECIES: sugar ABC transporter permease [Microbacterium]|uniref:carbohydrate ABC transporter permease n=1 Tax=Microbacterium TaxID=33882 RepID=UPI00146BCBF7|nr:MULTISPECIES: sugar ABC transporter permease [Microbacterium]
MTTTRTSVHDTVGVQPRLHPHGARRRRRRTGRREARLALAFLAPALLALILLRIWPMTAAALTSFTPPGGTDLAQLTLENFRFLFADAGFANMVRVTLLFSLIVNPLQIFLALALAVLLTQKLRGVRGWRVMVFLPAAVPQAVSAIVWGVAMRPDGPINGFLAVLGIPPQPFLSSPNQALLSIIVIVSWIGVGYWMMFLIAGLLDIPAMYTEAAALDGAGWWSTFWNVTLPQLRRPLAFVLVADTVANFLVFAPVHILTRGGPEGSTDLVMYEIYTRAYQFGDLSLAAAETVLLVSLVIAIVSVQFRLLPGRTD